MDFEDSPEDAAYRASARNWIERNAASFERARGRRDADEHQLAMAKRWQCLKMEAGYAGIDFPATLGGVGGTAMQRIIFDQEEVDAGMKFSFFGITLDICVPTLAKFGSEQDRSRRVPAAFAGDEIWCQLWSEPGAGSDLASIATVARRDGDGWRVSGRKVWTSYAQFADYGLLLARTDPTVPKHAGLTVFWIDMKSDAVDIRPIPQMAGGSDFNEVLIDDLFVPDSRRLGPVNGGWKVIGFALMNERLSIGLAGAVEHDDIVALARTLGCDSDPVLQAKIAEWYVREQGVKLTRYRTLTAMARGEPPGPENSIGKLVIASQLQDLSREGLLLEGEFGYLNDPADAVADNRFQSMFLWAPGLRLGGGSDEIMRTIIAERVLGLPSEPKADSGVPFDQRSQVRS